MAVVGILAGGVGSRLAAAMPKQFLEVRKKPIIIRTLEKFLAIDEFEKIFVAMHIDWMDYAKELLKAWNIDFDKIVFLPGGSTRFDSMNNLLSSAIKEGYVSDVMVVHDCARPFVPDKIIRSVLVAIKDNDMVTASIKTTDTILVSTDGKHSEYMPNRDTIYLDQGPQAFKINQLKELIDKMTPEQKENAIEAGAVYLNNGLKVGIVEGDRLSFKITNKIDMLIAEAVACEQEE